MYIKIYTNQIFLYFFLCTNILLHLIHMTAKEFLQSKEINLSHFAKKMWPKNNTAELYLYKKLSGERPWTEKDESKAKDILHDLGKKLSRI